MIAATDAEHYIFADPYHTGRMRWLEVTSLAMRSISCNVFTIIPIYVFSGMTEAYMTIACFPTQE